MSKYSDLKIELPKEISYLIYFPKLKLLIGIPNTTSISTTVGNEEAYVSYASNNIIRCMHRNENDGSFIGVTLPSALGEISSFIFSHGTQAKFVNTFMVKDMYAVLNVTTGEHTLLDSAMKVNEFAEDCECIVAYIMDGKANYLRKGNSHSHSWEKVETSTIPEAFQTYVMVVTPAITD